MTHPFSCGTALLALAALTLGGTARATAPQVTEYTSRAAFLAATTGLTTVTFDTLAPVGGSTDYPSGVTVGGVTFDSPGGFLSAFDPAAGSGDPFGGHQFLTDSGNGNGIDITLPTTVTAFGVDLTSAFNPGILIITTGGQNFNLTVPDGQASSTSAFVGFTSPLPLTQLIVTNSQNNFSQGADLGRVSVGQVKGGGAPAVPEPSPLIPFGLGGLGLGALAVTSRRRKSAG